MKRKSFDAFISHASEDKESFVEPLARELVKRGLKIWFDKFELRVGDSLRGSIEDGLASSRYGIVVYSPSFLKKRWTKAELNGLFSREMAGKPRILPILHDLRISELRKRYPIQADKFSLSSSLPLNEICDSLVKVIKPELLELDVLRETNLNSSKSFLRAASTKFPGYKFSLSTSGAGDGDVRQKIEIQSVNAEHIPIQISFVGEGVAKADEFLKTGKSQTWNSGEFTNLRANIPFFPQSSANLVFSMSPNLDSVPRSVRVEVGTNSKVVFPLMAQRIVRRGLEEGELLISSDQEAMSFTIVTSLVSTEYKLTLSWKLSGCSAARCQRLIDAYDQIRIGGPIKIIDLSEEKPTIELPTTSENGDLDPFDISTRKIISLCSQIEKYFDIKLIIKSKISERDWEDLHILDCLLNQKDFGENFSASLTMTKGIGLLLDAQLRALSGGQFEALSPVSNFRGYFEIFDTKIPTGTWGIRTNCTLDLDETQRNSFRAAPVGFQLKCRVVANEPSKLVWVNDNDSKYLSAQLTPQ